MAQIPKESIEKVLESTDIVDLISSYIPLKRAGAVFKANCPFHHEKTPSFQVSPVRQTFHCFGCGKHGDAIGFVRDYENLPFVEAVRKLASKAGVQIIEDQSTPQDDLARRSVGRLKDLHREATEFLHQLLVSHPDAEHARAYMKSRGFGRDMAERWSVGWMPRDSRLFLDWARAKKFTGRELKESGLAGLKDENIPASGIYVRFTDRLMFPIRNEIGDVIAFSGRKLREEQQGGKYQNSPETPIFKKSKVLFALDKAKRAIMKEKAVILCEGQIDSICCHEAGIENAIAPLGTAFTTHHARLLKRYTNNILLCYDSDGPGVAAAEKTFRELVTEGLSARVVEMPKGDDPDSYLRNHGAESFKELISKSHEFFDFKSDYVKSLGLLTQIGDRTKFANDCSALISAMTDLTAVEHHINLVARNAEMPVSVIRQIVAKIRSQPKRDDRDGGEITPPSEPTRLHRIVSALCHLALTSAPAQHYLADQFETLHEANRWVEGIPLLEQILAGAPDPASNAALNTFLSGLSEPDRLALMHESAEQIGTEEDGIQGAEHALALLSALVLQRRDAAVKGALKEPGLSTQRMLELLEEAKEISSLMRGIGQRSEFDDELAPSTFREKQPAWKKKWENKGK